MGIFSKTDYIRDDAPVYINQNYQYLYYWSPIKRWLIGSDYTKAVAGVVSYTSDSHICVESIDLWIYYSGGWKGGNLNIECPSNVQIFHESTSFL